jgi:hypothetical protein
VDFQATDYLIKKIKNKTVKKIGVIIIIIIIFLFYWCKKKHFVFDNKT